MVCSILPPTLIHAFAFQIYHVKFSKTLVKFINRQESISITICIVDCFPDRIPAVCILAHEICKKLVIYLNKTLNLSI